MNAFNEASARGAKLPIRQLCAPAGSRFASEDFGVRTEDRFAHIYIIGKTGTGRSTLIENMALHDLQLGRGFALIDPHGDLVERIAARVPGPRRSDTVYLDAADPKQPYGYNPLRQVRHDFIALAENSST